MYYHGVVQERTVFDLFQSQYNPIHKFVSCLTRNYIVAWLSDDRRGLDWYWDLVDIYTTRDWTLQITITQRLVLLVTVFTALLGNGFQQWTFFGFRAHVLTGWRPSQDYPIMAAGPRYIASARTAQETLPTALLFVRACATILFPHLCLDRGTR
jgi:hypothetical protein